MNYYLATLDLVWDPEDPAQVADIVEQISSLFNLSYISLGMATTCISVSRWDTDDTPVATYMVIDTMNQESILVDAFEAVLLALDLQEDIKILDRKGREDRVGRR